MDAVEILCAQKPRTYEGQDGSGEFASYLDLDTGEEKMSQSAVFPFFDRLLRQEVFPGKPKGVADQLPIDLLALPEKVSSMTELFRTLRIAEEICLKLSFISGLVIGFSHCASEVESAANMPPTYWPLGLLAVCDVVDRCAFNNTSSPSSCRSPGAPSHRRLCLRRHWRERFRARKMEECDIWGGWEGTHPTVTRPMQLDMLQVLGRLVELLARSL